MDVAAQTDFLRALPIALPNFVGGPEAPSLSTLLAKPSLCVSTFVPNPLPSLTVHWLPARGEEWVMPECLPLSNPPRVVENRDFSAVSRVLVYATPTVLGDRRGMRLSFANNKLARIDISMGRFSLSTMKEALDKLAERYGKMQAPDQEVVADWDAGRPTCFSFYDSSSTVWLIARRRMDMESLEITYAAAKEFLEDEKRCLSPAARASGSANKL